MSSGVRGVLSKYDLSPIRYTIKNKTRFIETEKGRFVLKPKLRSDKTSLYKYLKSRSFDYYLSPENDIDEDEVEIYPFIDEASTPKEQKALDIIYLIGLLHNKTTFYKEIDLDDIKALYEDLTEQITYLENYYHDLQDVIETHIYMSPSEYLLLRNISKVYASLSYCKGELEQWYKTISNKKKERFVMNHNNLELDHLLKGNNSYLISWDKAKIDIPIYDFYDLYKKYGLEFDFSVLLDTYESKYPLLQEEKSLLFILMALPLKIEFTKDEFTECSEVSKMLSYVYKTEQIISKYYPKQENEETN